MRFAYVVAALLALLSIAGIASPTLYAREAPAWSAQAIGQDWFDLLIAAPWLVVCGARAHRSPIWRVLLAGAYGYVVYETYLYAVAIHFNAMFLVYCATLGLAAFGLLATLDTPPLAIDRRGRHLAGGVLIAIGALFGLLWLAEDVPAVLRGAPPASLEEIGLPTNPVHAIDLAFVLPAHIVAGVLLWRGDPRGVRFAPIVLAFGVLMSASIGGMLVAIRLAGGVAPAPVIGAMLAVSAATLAVTWRAIGYDHAR